MRFELTVDAAVPAKAAKADVRKEDKPVKK